MITPGEVSDQFQCKRRGGDASLLLAWHIGKTTHRGQNKDTTIWRVMLLVNRTLAFDFSESFAYRKRFVPFIIKIPGGRLEGSEVRFPRVSGKKVSLGPAAIKN